MSARGTNFLHRWISNNVPTTNGADTISVAELTHELFADAKALRISITEIEEDTGSVYEAILDAIVHHDAGLADWSPTHSVIASILYVQRLPQPHSSAAAILGDELDAGRFEGADQGKAHQALKQRPTPAPAD
jgi:hypothetical protein